MFWSRSEKALLLVCAVAVAGGVVFTLELQHRDDLPVVSIPTPAMPSPNAFDYFDRARTLLVDTNKVDYAISPHHTPGYDQDDHPYTLAEKEKLMAENALGLKVMRQGFAYPYLSPPVRSFSTPIPYRTQYWQIARQLTLEEQVKTGLRDRPGAVNSSIDSLYLGVKVSHGGIINDLVGIACQAIGRRPAWTDATHLTAAQARTAARRLEKIVSQQVSFADTVQEGKWSGQAGLLEVMHQPNWRNHVGTLIGTTDDLLTRRLEIQLAFTSDKMIMADYTRAMDESIGRARLSYTSYPAPLHTPADPLTPFLIDASDGYRFKDTDNRTQNALLLTTLALRAYRFDHGTYPLTLASLVPKYLKAVPDDPFAASGPIHYRLTQPEYWVENVITEITESSRPIME